MSAWLLSAPVRGGVCSQWADTARIAAGCGSDAPQRARSAPLTGSVASVGAPWATKMIGIDVMV